MIKTEIAYLAGLLDGEGYIGIKRSKPYKPNHEVSVKYSCRVQVRMVEPHGIELLCKLFNGHSYKEKAHCNNGRPLYCYQASDRIAANILKTVLPYLRVKKIQAQKVLELAELKKETSKHRTKLVGYRNMKHWTGKIIQMPNLAYSDEFIGQMESLWQQCISLNRVGYI